MTTMEQKHERANSSQDEGNIKEEKDSNRPKRIVESSSSSPTTSFNHETQENGGENNKKDDDGDEIITPTAERHDEDSDVSKQGEELESTKAEMGEVMEENLRLKQHLSQMMKNYQILQRKFHEVSQQDLKQLKDNQMATPHPTQTLGNDDDDHDEAEELVSLSLGRSSSLDSKKLISSPNKLAINHSNDDKEANERSLDLGLECKFIASSTIDQTLMPSSSPDHSFDEIKDGEALKNSNVTSVRNGEDEVVHQPPMKKARVSVRVRCDTPTMNDGCQWRKYGQKIAKGNPCPRAYYRCTVAPSCPVRKQVQRCAEDMSILITTYEGAHNHPLPVSATAMASTTSAAAYMLMSKSSTSTNPGSHPCTTTTTTPIGAEVHGGLKFNILDNPNKPNPFYSHNSTFSPTPTHPTVTLDLTSTTLSSTNQFHKVAPNLGSYSSTNLTFNFSDNSRNPLLHSWPNGLPSYDTQSHNKAEYSIGSSNNSYTFQPSPLQKNVISNNVPNHDSNIPDTFAQAAKVLTSDPSFQSILTATLSSFISGKNGNTNNGIVGNNTIHHEGKGNVNSTGFVDSIKWGGLHTSSTSSTFHTTSKESNGYASSLFSKVPLTSKSEATRNLMFLSSSLPLSSTRSSTPSPDNKNQTT